MNKIDLISPLTQTLFTQAEKLWLEEIILQLSTQGQITDPNHVFANLPYQFALALKKSWTEYTTKNSQAKISLTAFLQTISDQLAKTNISQLTLAYQPSETQARELCLWLRQHLHDQQLILKLIIKPEILLGGILEYQGKRYDLRGIN